jgi:hypothetical protein
MAPVIHGHGIGGRVFSMYQFGLSAYDKEFQRLEPLGTLIRVDISVSAPEVRPDALANLWQSVEKTPVSITSLAAARLGDAAIVEIPCEAARRRSSTSSARKPNMKMLSAPTGRTLAPIDDRSSAYPSSRLLRRHRLAETPRSGSPRS